MATQQEIEEVIKMLDEKTEELIVDFIDYCKKGPAWARIDKIEIEAAEVNEELTAFDS